MICTGCVMPPAARTMALSSLTPRTRTRSPVASVRRLAGEVKRELAPGVVQVVDVEVVGRIGVIDVQDFELAGLVGLLLDEGRGLRRQAGTHLRGQRHAEELAGVRIDQRREIEAALLRDRDDLGEALTAIAGGGRFQASACIDERKGPRPRVMIRHHGRVADPFAVVSVTEWAEATCPKPNKVIARRSRRMRGMEDTFLREDGGACARGFHGAK